MQPTCSVCHLLEDICGDGHGGSLGQTMVPQLTSDDWWHKSGQNPGKYKIKTRTKCFSALVKSMFKVNFEN